MAQLTGEEKKQFLRQKLEEQRHLLRKSIKEFEAGDLAEAIRLAVAIRVLVHETSSCKPLLGQLTPNYLQLTILDRKPPTPPKAPPGHGAAIGMWLPIALTISEKGVQLNTKLTPENYVSSILGKWWSPRQPCLILPGLGGLSRKEIVLGVADKGRCTR